MKSALTRRALRAHHPSPQPGKGLLLPTNRGFAISFSPVAGKGGERVARAGLGRSFVLATLLLASTANAVIRSNPQGELQSIEAIAPSQLTAQRLENFARDVDDFPPGDLRHHARAFVADAWRRTLHDPAKAIAAYNQFLAEPDLSKPERVLAVRNLSRVYQDQNDAMGAFRTLRENGLQGSEAYEHLEIWAMEKWGKPIAFAIIAMFFGLVGLAIRKRGIPGGWHKYVFWIMAALATLSVAALIALHVARLDD
jgi:hypothetical protein